AMGFVTDVWQLLGLRIVQGAVTGSQAAAAALIAGVVPAGEAGFALGVLATAVQVGNTVGPAVGGITVGSLGFRGSFIAAGVMLRPEWLTPEVASGLSITATAITAALAMPFLGKWIDRRGPYGLLIVSLAGSALVLIVQALVPTIGLFLALRAVLGVWLAGIT